MYTEHKELQQATRHFIQSMFRTGVSIALLPVKRLPEKPQQHFRASGREFTRGLATLIHELGDGLEGIAKDANVSANLGEEPHTHEELE